LYWQSNSYGVELAMIYLGRCIAGNILHFAIFDGLELKQMGP